MREIKFRAWLKYRKEIVDVEEIDFMNKVINYIDNDYENNRQEIIVACFEDIELMEYTGLKDKNEKEIYEGDIVKLRANHGIGVVKYYDEWGAFVVEYIKPRPLAVLGMNYYKEDIEVIGNIYENSELLGDKNEKNS